MFSKIHELWFEFLYRFFPHAVNAASKKDLKDYFRQQEEERLLREEEDRQYELEYQTHLAEEEVAYQAMFDDSQAEPSHLSDADLWDLYIKENQEEIARINAEMEEAFGEMLDEWLADQAAQDEADAEAAWDDYYWDKYADDVPYDPEEEGDDDYPLTHVYYGDGEGGPDYWE